ncbi:MAG TPA: hypothetical protein VF748_14505 [Candidatus Acidoferrum sp.]
MSNEPNRQWYRYVTDGGVNMGIVADQDWGNNAASGLTAFNASDPAFGPQSRNHRLRHAVYVDPATFRTKRVPVGTTAAFAALPATLSVPLPGSATPETYNLSLRYGEKMRIPKPSRNLVDRPS